MTTSMSAGTRFSIVVVTYECAGALETLVHSMNSHLGSYVELIVVDNASSDEPERVARAWKGNGAYLQLASNHGFGTAVNVGVGVASCDAVVVLNADTELVDGSLASLAAFALQERAIVGPRVLNRNGSVQPSASGPPVGPWPWLRAILPAGTGPRWMVSRLHPWCLSDPTEVAWLTGCCLAAPREALRALGPFDHSIHMYGEDLDLGIRAHQAGMPVILAPDLCALIHDGKGSSSAVYRDLGRAQAGINGRLVLRRAYGGRREWLAWIAERMSLALRSRAKMLLGRDSDWERLVAAGLREARPVSTLPASPETPPDPPSAIAVRRLDGAESTGFSEAPTEWN